jgi:hypothetical protein
VLPDTERNRHGRGYLHLPAPQTLAAMPAVDYRRARLGRHAVAAVLALALAADLAPHGAA